MAASAGVRPIETRYKGYRFRSRLEARWAVVFDAAGIDWHYEHEGYDLGELGWYLPDFWLPGLNTHVEVKPDFKASEYSYDLSMQEKKLLAVCKSKMSFGAFCTDFNSVRPVQSEDRHECFVDAKWPETVKRLYEPLHFAAGVTATSSLQDDPLIPGGKPFPCPICGGLGDGENGYGTHFNSDSVFTLKGDYEASAHFPGSGVSARGGVTGIKMFCESCNNQWYFLLAFHKGTTDMGIVWDPLQDLGPLERFIQPQHLQAGKSARFEHGEAP